jgi:hypothetical protein
MSDQTPIQPDPLTEVLADQGEAETSQEAPESPQEDPQRALTLEQQKEQARRALEAQGEDDTA